MPDLSCYYQGESSQSSPQQNQERAISEDPDTDQDTTTQSERKCPEAKAALEIADVESQISMARAAITQAVINLVGLGLLGVTIYFTWHAAQSTEQTLKIANRTLGVTRDNAAAELRAYISIENMTFSLQHVGLIASVLDAPAVRIRMKFIFRNAGQTPAYGLKFGSVEGFYEGWMKAIPAWADNRTPRSFDDVGTLASGQTHDSDISLYLTREEFDHMNDGGSGVAFIRIFTEYRDVFRRTIKGSFAGCVSLGRLFDDAIAFNQEVKLDFAIMGGEPLNGEEIIDPPAPETRAT